MRRALGTGPDRRPRRCRELAESTPTQGHPKSKEKVKGTDLEINKQSSHMSAFNDSLFYICIYHVVYIKVHMT